MENSKQDTQMIKNKTMIRFGNFTPGYEYQENGNTAWKRYMHPNGHTITKTESKVTMYPTMRMYG